MLQTRVTPNVIKQQAEAISPLGMEMIYRELSP
jgi:hypothetical protein